jgi:hypothetical protein
MRGGSAPIERPPLVHERFVQTDRARCSKTSHGYRLVLPPDREMADNVDQGRSGFPPRDRFLR